MNLKKEYDKTLKYANCKWGVSADCLEVCEDRADHLSNNLRLNKISIFIFFQFSFKINKNQSEIVLKGTYGLHPDKYVEILNLKFWEKSLVTRHFKPHSNFRGLDEIKGLPKSCYSCLVLYLYYCKPFSQ